MEAHDALKNKTRKKHGRNRIKMDESRPQRSRAAKSHSERDEKISSIVSLFGEFGDKPSFSR